MKLLFLTILSFFTLQAPEIFSQTLTHPEHYDAIVIGAGPGGLATARSIQKNTDKKVYVFSTNIGGPALRGQIPTTWIERPSWKHHARPKILADSWGISTKDIQGESKIEDLQAYINKLIEEVGRDNIKGGYTLTEIKTDRENSEAPLELTFKNERTGNFEIIKAKTIELAIPPEELNKVKFS